MRNIRAKSHVAASTVAVVVAEPETREVATVHGRFVGAPSRAQLERIFFLDDADRRLVAKR